MQKSFRKYYWNSWKKLHKIYNAGVKVKMRHPKQPPDLMTVVHGLRSFIDEDSFPGKSNYGNFAKGFKWLEGLETSHKNVWTYLNKGTYDEIGDEEFDRAVVKGVLNIIIELDNEAK